MGENVKMAEGEGLSDSRNSKMKTRWSMTNPGKSSFICEKKQIACH